jgi:hypothetical protein
MLLGALARALLGIGVGFAFASLAGTYKGVDDEHAHALYRRALEIDHMP